MIRVGRRVSLFNNIGKEGIVVGYKKHKRVNTNWSTIPQSNFVQHIVIQWDDGTTSDHPIGDVMRID
ncbi:TPA: hypothetical protein HA278_01470 [Candidatus Woesearchaeota archaeon]|nr:hypothetical protein [Candidatus Woesearchaeota archaeon]